MIDLLRSGEAWLRQQRNEYMSRPVTYYRSGIAYPIAAACQGSTTSEIEQGDMIVESKSIDWMLDRTALAFTPAPGDLITVDHGGSTRIYEVAAISGEAAWRWHGTDGESYRIHTRETNDLGLLPVTDDGLFAAHFGALFGNHFGGNW